MQEKELFQQVASKRDFILWFYRSRHLLVHEYNFSRLLYVYFTSVFYLLWIDLFESKHAIIRISPPEVFLGKGVLKLCSKFTGEHSWRSVISIKLPCNFIEITLRHWCSAVNLLHIFGPSLRKNNTGGLLLDHIV